MAVSVVGDVDHGEVQNIVSKHFSSVPAFPVNGIRPFKAPAMYIGSDIRIRDDDMPRVHLAIGFETAGWNDPDHYSLMALQMMLGSHNQENTPTDIYSSSEMVKKVADNRMANSIQPFNTIYSDTGIFGLYAVAGCNTLDVLGDHMIKSLVNHATHVPQQSLVEAKAKLQFSLLSQYEGTENTVQELSRQLLSHGRRIHPVEILKRVENIDQASVQNVVKRFFVDQDFTVAAIGNTFELQDYALLRKKAAPIWM
jgi:processing peptidase subunit beta